MTKRRFLRLTAVAGLVGFAGCQKGGVIADPNVDYYTCTMHPSVRSHDPNGKCPICSMNLVPVYKKGAAPGGTPSAVSGPVLHEFQVPVERQQQIGVTYATVERKPLRRVIRTVGTVAPDKTRLWGMVARVEGYVQRLHVASPGEAIAAGQPIVTLYSPELVTAERELVNLLNARDRATTPEGKASSGRSIEAARQRLAQWNVAAPQIAQVEKSRNPSDSFTLEAPVSGLVQAVPVTQGGRVMPGDRLVDIADLSVVWVWAEFYLDEIPALATGQSVRITAPSIPGRSFEGKVGLIDPFLPASVARVRIELPNSDLKLQPGMYVNVELAVDRGEGLTIPVSAVLPTGLRSLVFVDKGAGKLEPRFAQLGGKFGETFEVLGGLQDGERVVASANFLIDAESKVQGAVKSFEATAASEVTRP